MKRPYENIVQDFKMTTIILLITVLIHIKTHNTNYCLFSLLPIKLPLKVEAGRAAQCGFS